MLAARNLLFVQDELTELEAKLARNELEEPRRGKARDQWNLYCRREDTNMTMNELMTLISFKPASCCKFSKVLRSFTTDITLRSTQGPSRYNFP